MPRTSLHMCVSAAIAVCVVAAPATAHAQWSIDLETGAASVGLNNVRIPGDGGTRLSLTKDLSSDLEIYWRVRVERRLGQRHRISAVVAPLRVRSNGRLERNVLFTTSNFPAGADVRALYRFDSYRLTYAYEVLRRSRWRLDVGVTAKIRDAEIRLTSPSDEAVKGNTGFVPLVHFAVIWDISDRLRALLQADALAAPQGRAEDVQFAVSTRLSDGLRLRAGYRVLEGGADNDEVYTFALIHYALVGLTWSL